MSDYSEQLQGAIIMRLRSDPLLMGMVKDIYDTPPADAAMPFLTIGEIAGSAADTDETSTMQANFSLEVHSRSEWRIEAMRVMKTAIALLHRNEDKMDIPSPLTLVNCYHQATAQTRGDEGQAWIVSATFRAVVDRGIPPAKAGTQLFISLEPNASFTRASRQSGVMQLAQVAEPIMFPSEWVIEDSITSVRSVGFGIINDAVGLTIGAFDGELTLAIGDTFVLSVNINDSELAAFTEAHSIVEISTVSNQQFSFRAMPNEMNEALELLNMVATANPRPSGYPYAEGAYICLTLM